MITSVKNINRKIFIRSKLNFHFISSLYYANVLASPLANCNFEESSPRDPVIKKKTASNQLKFKVILLTNFSLESFL